MDRDALTYNLKDFEIFNSSESFDFSVWIPDKTYIVIGRSNTADESVFIEKAHTDKIEILKRPSGGETVILSAGTIVISVKLSVDSSLNTHKYFRIINERIISGLHKLGIKDLNMKGISDISVGNKKILGSSIYRRSGTIFYHAVLNVSESVEQIEKYLKHPKREPDYRKGRSHSEFVTSLKSEGYLYDSDIISEGIIKQLSIFSENNKMKESVIS